MAGAGPGNRAGMGWSRRLERLLREVVQSDLADVRAELTVNRAVAINYEPNSTSRTQAEPDTMARPPAPADGPSDETRSR